MALVRINCSRCNGAGGWEGWPGYVCYLCGGKAFKMVDDAVLARRAKAAEAREAKRRAIFEETRAANEAKCEIVYAALHAHYANDALIQAKIAPLEPAYKNNYLIDRFRGEMARRCHVQVPFGIPTVAEHIDEYLAALTASKE